jgi:hypothetical protein
MNPWSLLNKGHTIKGFKNRAGAYRLTNRGGVPNFSAGKNMSPTASHPERDASQTTLFDKPKPPAAVPAPAPPQPTLARQPVGGQLVWNRLADLCRAFLQRWTATRKMSPFQGHTVQTELALERVRVVRNDLSEDDMEVIPVGKKEKSVQHEQCQVLFTDR